LFVFLIIIIKKRCPDGKIRLYCKGADSVLYRRIQEGEPFLEQTKKHVHHFAEEGLRILVYAYAVIDEERYETWRKIYQEAGVSLERRQEALADVAELIERNLNLLGATAIEDRLQEGVPDTIQSLTLAGIKVWMLTGDKLETAINVGYACSLIQKDSKLLVLAHDEGRDSVSQKLKRGFRLTENWEGDHTVMVIDGFSLAKIMEESNEEIGGISGVIAGLQTGLNSGVTSGGSGSLLAEFLSLTSLINCVICCRVSPIQKAQIVQAVRRGMSRVTLAVGDGANDISMIQAAHVGVGINGREGMQAARASDYSIAQFRFLKRLLLVHGHWNYLRVSKFFLGSFYKCMAFYLTQAVFQPFAGFSSTSLYEQWTLASYNLFFSSLPVIFIGMFEKDLTEHTLLSFPQLYYIGNKSTMYNFTTFSQWMLSGIYHAIVVSVVPFYMYGYVLGLEWGNDDGLYLLGTFVYTSVIFVVTFKIGFLESNHWTWANQLANWGSIAIWFIYQAVYSQLINLGYVSYGIFSELWQNPKYLLVVTLTTVMALLPDILFKFVKLAYYPEVYQQFQLLERLGSGRTVRSSSTTSSSLPVDTPASTIHSNNNNKNNNKNNNARAEHELVIL